jgi:hypothetical protein
MAGSGRQDRDIARAQLDRAAMLAAEMDAGATARDPHHFMNARMIVKIVVNSVSPASRPAVAFKNIFEDSSRVKGSRQADGAPKDDKRPARMIGRLSVIPESEFADSSEADQFAELRLGGAFPAGHFLGRFLEIFKKKHDNALRLGTDENRLSSFRFRLHPEMPQWRPDRKCAERTDSQE